MIDARSGVHPYISVTLAPPDADPEGGQLFGVEMALLDSTGDVCATTAADDVPAPGRHLPIIAVLNGPVFGDPDAGEPCPTDELAVLQVNRFGEAYADRPLEAEIVVRMEPPAVTDGLPGPATEGVALPTPAHGTPVDLAGGGSFDQAATVAGGQSYRDTIGTGESRYYRVPLGWGQRFAYSITEIGPADPLVGPGGVEVTADVFNPVREVDGFASTGSLWFGAERGASLGADTDYPVRYTNRDAVLPAIYSLDGFYYLRLSAYRSAQPSRTDYVLTVTIDGQTEPGPTYRAGETDDPAAGSRSPGSGSESRSASGGVTGAGTTPAVPTARADPVRSGGPAWGWWAGAAVAGLAGLALALVLRTHRRGRTTGPR